MNHIIKVDYVKSYRIVATYVLLNSTFYSKPMNPSMAIVNQMHHDLRKDLTGGIVPQVDVTDGSTMRPSPHRLGDTGKVISLNKYIADRIKVRQGGGNWTTELVILDIEVHETVATAEGGGKSSGKRKSCC